MLVKTTASYQSNSAWINSNPKERIIFTTHTAQLKLHVTVFSVFSAIYFLLGYYATENGNSVRKFRSNIEVPFTRLKESNIS